MEEFDALMTLMNNVNFMDEVELELQDILAHTSDLEQMVIVYIISHLFAHVHQITRTYEGKDALRGDLRANIFREGGKLKNGPLIENPIGSLPNSRKWKNFGGN